MSTTTVQGPVELALDAFKSVAVARVWLAADEENPSSRQTTHLWLEPRLVCLQLRIIQQLTLLFFHISAPRRVAIAQHIQGCLLCTVHIIGKHPAPPPISSPMSFG